MSCHRKRPFDKRMCAFLQNGDPSWGSGTGCAGCAAAHSLFSSIFGEDHLFPVKFGWTLLVCTPTFWRLPPPLPRIPPPPRNYSSNKSVFRHYCRKNITFINVHRSSFSYFIYECISESDYPKTFITKFSIRYVVVR